MPLYDYSCENCGAFRDWRPMSAAAEPADCPTCGHLSSRVITAPYISCINHNTRIAHERNERSAHEPQVISRQQLDHLGVKRTSHNHHRGAEHHNHPHHPKQRWMIGH